MKILFTLFVAFLLVQTATAQKTEGIVSYEHRQYWSKINNRMTFLSREEKDRMANTWKNFEENKTKMTLYFSPSQSLYTYTDLGGAEEAGDYAGRKDDYVIHRNFDKDKKTDIIETLGKTYIVDDSLHAPVWKVQNQIKEVAGYVCMKAETNDPIKGQKITAWFAQDIPGMAGPERYFGLPGIILELDVNDGELIIEATKVEFKTLTKEFTLPKSKGKKTTDAAYDTLLKNHIAESVKAQRNPYWTIRY